MKGIHKLKDEVDKHLEDTFGIKPEQTQLYTYPTEVWEKFLDFNKLKPANGYYFPYIKTAYIPEKNIWPILMFHEYYGHGFYAEYSKAGQELQSICSEIETLRIQDSYGVQSTQNEAELWNKLSVSVNDDRPTNEGFANWMELYLSELTGNMHLLEESYGQSIPEKEFFKFYGYGLKYGKHALLYSLGFEKHYNKTILEDILRRLFRDDFNSIDFALLHGSKKPTSDIDLFIVSDKIESCNYNWLDISAVSREELGIMTSLMDISTTDPLFTGELICGNEKYLEQVKRKVLEMPITKEMIDFNKQHAPKAKAIASEYPKGTKPYLTAMRYSKTYEANAKELKQGRKALTLKNLAAKYPELK